MKVVLFCGGLGLRLREYDENLPKPMVPIGYRPILWHVMKYYAHFGHRDFILCLGYRADVVKNYFRNYDECVSNDFVLSGGGKTLELLRTDIEDWRITFVDTGINSTIGERLKAVERHVRDEPVFLANYSDGLTDLPLPAQLEHFHRHDAVASFVSVKPAISYHFVTARNGGVVTGLEDVARTGMRINGGYFVLRREIFSLLHRGEDLVTDAFPRLIPDGRLVGYRYDGFWQSMDTFKDKQRLDELYARGDAPWEVAKHDGGATGKDARPLRLPASRRRALHR
ncbi:MAG TPA: sugar phosphate nucleotidyltransferase [Gemmatimonadales bacterium]|nr:sugar phosphate nucleotidyltransferase [Gemmatimonadales bacterium]